MEGGDGGGEAAPMPLGGHRAKTRGQSRGRGTGMTARVPHVGFLKLR